MSRLCLIKFLWLCLLYSHRSTSSRTSSQNERTLNKLIHVNFYVFLCQKYSKLEKNVNYKHQNSSVDVQWRGFLCLSHMLFELRSCKYTWNDNKSIQLAISTLHSIATNFCCCQKSQNYAIAIDCLHFGSWLSGVKKKL